jgi:hypothetical protein
MSVHRRPLFAGVLVLASACASYNDVSTVEQSALGCSKAYCGNTPELNGQEIRELDMTGNEFSPRGEFRITSAWSGTVRVSVHVDGFKMYGLSSAGKTKVIDRFYVESMSGDRFEATVMPGPLMGYLDTPLTFELPTYQVTYQQIVGKRKLPPRQLCVSPTPVSIPIEALVFSGDRFDDKANVIATGDDAGTWFNITCRDDAMWKLALMRHVEAAIDATHETTQDQRTAGLKSIIADYCGGGDPTTEEGVDVQWLNAGGWLTLEPDPELEAIWGPDGAVCVNFMRVPELGPISCDLPACTYGYGDDPLWTEGDWTQHGSMQTWAHQDF